MPFVAELMSAMEPAAEAHERFVATWSQVTTLSWLTQETLQDDVCALTRTWAGVIGVAIDHAPAD